MIDNVIFTKRKLRDNQIASLKHITKLQKESALVILYSKKQKQYKIIPYYKIACMAINDRATIDFTTQI
jgi:hypothetical protein